MVLQVFRNFGILAFGKIMGDVLTLVFFVDVSRTFGPEGIGQYSFAMAFTAFFVGFSQFGFYNLSIKEMSRQKDGLLGDYYGGILSLRLILTTVVLAVILIVVYSLPYSYEAKLIIVLIAVYQLLFSLVNGFCAVFLSRDDTHWAGLLEFSLKTVAALGGVSVIESGGTIHLVIAVLPAVALGHFLVAYLLVRKKYGSLKLVVSWAYCKRTLRRAMPYAFTTILFPLQARMDVLFLGLYLSASVAGVYNAAYRVVFMLQMFTHFAGIALLPIASRMYKSSSREELVGLYTQSLNLMILAMLPAAAGLWLIAPDLIQYIFGDNFSESASILRILCVLVFVSGLRNIVENFLTSCDQQGSRARCQLVAALVNVSGNLTLIPFFGIEGAAVATIISEMTHLILLVLRASALLGKPQIGSRLAISGLAVIVFSVPSLLSQEMSLVLTILVSIMVYVIVLMLFGTIRKNEGRMLRNLVEQHLYRKVRNSAYPAPANENSTKL